MRHRQCDGACVDHWWKENSGHPRREKEVRDGPGISTPLEAGAETRMEMWKSQTMHLRTRFPGSQKDLWPGALTASPASGYLPKLASGRMYDMDRAARYEADLQASQSQAGQQARIPSAHEDARGPQGPVASPQEGTRQARRVRRRKVAPAEPGAGEGLPREARIRSRNEIRGLLERGKRERTAGLDVFFAPSPASRSRLGLIVPKYGRRIVDRNKLKRRLRELGRRVMLPSLEARGVSRDVLFRARPRAYAMDFGELAADVRGTVEVICSAES